MTADDVSLIKYKTFLRNYFRDKVDVLSDGEKKRASARLSRHLVGSKVWTSARVIALFVSRADEPDTSFLIQAAARMGRRVVLPTVDPESRTLSFRHADGALRPNVHGIPEPLPTARSARSGDIDLVVVPGRAYTRQGDRLGSGGGYYDRWLAAHPGIPAAGIAFDEQVAARLPVAPHDRRVGFLATPSGFFRAEPPARLL